MKKNKFEINSMGKCIFRIIWCAVAIPLWITMLIEFLKAQRESGSFAFGMWMLWGAVCAVLSIGDSISVIRDSTRSGRADGAREYTISGNTISNHPFRGALIGLVAGIVACLLIGPVLIPLYVIFYILGIVLFFVKRARAKKTGLK